MHWSINYMGIPWVAGGRTPDGFDCWGLVREIYQSILNIDLPMYIVDPNMKVSVSKCMITALDEWVRVDSPKNNCLVVMSKNKHPSHVGVYIDDAGGLILHSVDGVGSCAQFESEVRQEYKLLEFYEHGSLRNNHKPI